MAVGKKKDYQLQRKLNTQVFEQNKELAQLENTFNIDQWNRENEYNTPQAQMERLQAAGLNPDLVVQGLGGVSASSPQLSAGTPMETFDVSKFTANQISKMQTGMQAVTGISDALLKDKQGQLLDAQISNVQADTERKQYDLGFEKDVRHFKVGQERNAFMLGDVQIDVGRQNIKLSDKQMEVLGQSMEESKARVKQINQSIEESVAKIKNLDVDTQIKLIEKAWKEPTIKKQLEHMGSQIRLINAQAYSCETTNMYLGQQLMWQTLGIANDAVAKEKQIQLYDVNLKQAKLDFSNDATFSKIERGIGIVSEIANTQATVITSVANMVDAVVPM